MSSIVLFGGRSKVAMTKEKMSRKLIDVLDQNKTLKEARLQEKRTIKALQKMVDEKSAAYASLERLMEADRQRFQYDWKYDTETRLRYVTEANAHQQKLYGHNADYHAKLEDAKLNYDNKARDIDNDRKQLSRENEELQKHNQRLENKIFALLKENTSFKTLSDENARLLEEVKALREENAILRNANVESQLYYIEVQPELPELPQHPVPMVMDALALAQDKVEPQHPDPIDPIDTLAEDLAVSDTEAEPEKSESSVSDTEADDPTDCGAPWHSHAESDIGNSFERYKGTNTLLKMDELALQLVTVQQTEETATMTMTNPQPGPSTTSTTGPGFAQPAPKKIQKRKSIAQLDQLKKKCKALAQLDQWKKIQVKREPVSSSDSDAEVDVG